MCEGYNDGVDHGGLSRFGHALRGLVWCAISVDCVQAVEVTRDEPSSLHI